MRLAFGDLLAMTTHQSQLLEITAADIPNSRGGVTAGRRQSPAAVVEREVQHLVLVSRQGGQTGACPYVPDFRGFVHGRRRDQRAVKVVQAVREPRAMPG